MHVRQFVPFVALLAAAALAGCTSDLSSADFTLKPTEVGWKIGQEALFNLQFHPEGSDVRTYNLDPVFAIEQVRFEKGGLNAFGDYETKRAAELSVGLVSEGREVANYTLTPSAAQIGLRVKIPDSLDNDEYTLEVELFKVGWVKSDVFRVAV